MGLGCTWCIPPAGTGAHPVALWRKSHRNTYLGVHVVEGPLPHLPLSRWRKMLLVEPIVRLRRHTIFTSTCRGCRRHVTGSTSSSTSRIYLNGGSSSQQDYNWKICSRGRHRQRRSCHSWPFPIRSTRRYVGLLASSLGYCMPVRLCACNCVYAPVCVSVVRRVVDVLVWCGRCAAIADVVSI